MTDIAITTENRLEKIQNYIAHMPSLSTTSTKVMEICNNPTTSPNDLNRVISLDPVLTGRVLKLINSAYYYFPKEVTSLTRTIVMLGMNTVKNLAVSMAVMECLGGDGSFQALSMDDFWSHSICVGVAAKSLAAIKNIPVTMREEYFVAGLLHDLGKIPMMNGFPDEYSKALELTKIENVPLHEAEDTVFATDHCTVGGMIADKWQLSGTLTDVLCHHHDPEKASDEHSLLVAIVALGNIYSNTIEIGSAGDSVHDEPMTNYLLEKVGISWDKLSGLYETIVDEIEKAQIFLQIAKKG